MSEQPPDPQWRANYDAAKRLLEKGSFAEARQQFQNLEQTAHDESDRRLAAELAALASYWESRGDLLVAREEMEDSAVIARRENRRTTDEIGVLYPNAVAYGIGSGAWLAFHTDPDDLAGVIMPALAIAGAATGTVALLDSGRGLGYGVPQSIVSGMYLGLGEGVTLTLWNQARVHSYEEWEDKTVANLIWASATAGAVAGGVLGSIFGTTPGRASYVGSAGLWSAAVIGLTVGSTASDEERVDDRALLAAAIGLNAGAIGGVLTADTVAPSIGRVRFLDLGAAAGGLVFGGLFVSAAGDDTDVQPVLGVTALGITAGLVAAWVLTDGMPKDRLLSEAATSAKPPPSVVRVGLVPNTHGGELAAFGSF